MEYGLGRTPSPPDSRDYQLSKLLAVAPSPTYPPRKWHGDRILNQMTTPHCVGFGWAGWGIAQPVETSYFNGDAHAIYYKAKVYDLQPRMENGSTVRSGAKVMLSRKRIKSYYFANDIAEAEEFVAHHGTVVLGIDWYEGMRVVDTRGIIVPTGKKIGGHCVLWTGVDGLYAILRNSWGVRWGVGGECKISLRDLSDIFQNHGEACAAVEAPAIKSAAFLSDLYQSIVNLRRKG